jgi:hypothetical protein
VGSEDDSLQGAAGERNASAENDSAARGISAHATLSQVCKVLILWQGLRGNRLSAIGPGRNQHLTESSLHNVQCPVCQNDQPRLHDSSKGTRNGAGIGAAVVADGRLKRGSVAGAHLTIDPQ